jgi:hypothetical protein
MPYDASNRKDIRRAEKAAKLAERNRATVLVQLASTAAGREFLWNTLAEAHVFTSTFSENPARAAFLEGQRSAGLRLLDSIMQSCPDQFIQAMREANARRTATDTIDRNSNDAFDPADGGLGEQPGGEESGREPEGISADSGDEAGN